jgi:NAD(P)-dependent dehydrogenase (short-subunit alcohol dehydrogenase family)
MKNATLDKQVAIVTGGGGETGAAIARMLGGLGARVVVNDLNPDRAERVAEAICADGSEALAVAADVANRFQCVNLIETTREKWGRLDILVSSANVRPVDPLLKMDEWAWQRCMDVNLKSAFFMSQLVGRVMVEENRARGGVIIHVGDIRESYGALGLAAYAASQGGLSAFSQQCALEFAPLGIRVAYIPSRPRADSEAATDTIVAKVAEVLRY